MSDYNNEGFNYHSKIVETSDDETYLIQGQIDDEIVMMRPVDELLECEREPVQVLMGDKRE